MKEILFRAWEKYGERMLYSEEDLSEFSWLLEDGTIKLYIWNGCEHDLLKDIELMQYTGLKDKNGKKIYEGDIVKHSDMTVVVKIGEFKPNWLNEICTLFRFSRKHCITGVYCECSGGEQCVIESNDISEIIGNIYENPELLEDVT